jgi:branched-subunit amino acid ABC-type transport system permease component
MLVFEQALNGLQFSAVLFLIASGLTLVFGVMNFVNLAHGSFFMIGAYVAAWVSGVTGSFWLGVLAALAGRRAGRCAAGVAGVPPALSARPHGPGAGHLRLHPDLQRSGAHHLGAAAAWP